MATKTGEPSWKWRRTMAFVIVGFCMAVIAFMIDRSDTELNATIVSGAFWLIGAAFICYGGFATGQDVAAILATRTGRPYAEPPEPRDGPQPPPNEYRDGML